MSPPPTAAGSEDAGFAWVARTVAPGATIAHRSRIYGGLAAVTHALDLRLPDGTTRPLLTKRLVNPEIVPETEWAGITFAATLPVRTPAPVAFFAPGVCFAEPCIVMERLDGVPDLSVAGLGRTDAQASVIATLHEADHSEAPPVLRRPHLTADWEAPGPFPEVPLFRTALATLADRLAEAVASPEAFLHSDLNPGNVLWSGDEFAGLVDWSVCRVGCPAWDVSYWRAELALLAGLPVADTFLAAYTARRGPLHLQPVFDVVCGLNAWAYCPQWAGAFRFFGRTDVNGERLRAAAEVFIAQALDAL